MNDRFGGIERTFVDPDRDRLAAVGTAALHDTVASKSSQYPKRVPRAGRVLDGVRRPDAVGRRTGRERVGEGNRAVGSENDCMIRFQRDQILTRKLRSRLRTAVNTCWVLSERRRRFPQVLADDEGGLRRETHRTAIGGDTS
jgi:hypothetical protein